MKASRENCREAYQRLQMILSGDRSDQNVKFVVEFLYEAEKKLPKEDSFAKDMIRRAGNGKGG